MLDEETGRFIAEDKIIYLSVTETECLKLFIYNKGRVLTHEEVSKGIYPDQLYNINRIRQVIFRLNNKLKGYVRILPLIGFGYTIKYVGA